MNLEKPRQRAIYSTDRHVLVNSLKIDTRVDPYFSIKTSIEDSGFDLDMAIGRSGVLQLNYRGSERIERRIPFAHCELKLSGPDLHILVDPLTNPELETKSYEDGSLSLSVFAGISENTSRLLLLEKETRNLTKREEQILLATANGDSSTEIARKLQIKPDTIYQHTSSLEAKFGVRNKIELLIAALAEGVLSRNVLEPDYQNEHGPSNITVREFEVLQLIAIGMSSVEAAKRLVISQGTINKHVSALREKFETSSMLKIAIRAIKTGLVPINEPEKSDTLES